jgi:serine/threonine protein kinase
LVAEVKLWVNLQHDTILPLSGVVYDRSSGLLMATVCPYATGGNLLEFARQPGALTLALLKKFARAMFTALHYLHSQSPPIVHCNPSAANWLVFLPGRRVGGGGEVSVKLGDFVSARSLSGVGPWKLPWTTRLCTAPEWEATEGYISVEHPHAAFAKDVYAVGVTICQLVDESLRGFVNSKDWASDKCAWLGATLGYLRGVDAAFATAIAATVDGIPATRLAGLANPDLLGPDVGKFYLDSLPVTPDSADTSISAGSGRSSLGGTVRPWFPVDFFIVQFSISRGCLCDAVKRRFPVASRSFHSSKQVVKPR